MAGATDSTAAPYPTGHESTVMIRMGGYTRQGLSDHVLDIWIAPWDCKVIAVYRSYTSTHATEDLDAITLKTIDSSVKTIVADLDASGDIAGVKQTLHDDIIDFNIVKGNGIKMMTDSRDADEKGCVTDTILLRPTRG